MPNGKILIDDNSLYYNNDKNEIIHTITTNEVAICHRNIFTKEYSHVFNDETIYHSGSRVFDVECINFQELNIIPIYCICSLHCTQGNVNIISTDESDGFYLHMGVSNSSYTLAEINKEKSTWVFTPRVITNSYIYCFNFSGAIVNCNNDAPIYENINNLSYQIEMASYGTPYSNLSGQLNISIHVDVLTIGMFA